MPSNFRRLSFVVALLGGLSAAAVDPVRAETTERYDWGSAVPISTAGPAWYDDAYYQQVIANGVAGTSLPSGAQMPDDGTYAAAGTTSTGETVPGVERPPIGIGPGTWLMSVGRCVRTRHLPVAGTVGRPPV